MTEQPGDAPADPAPQPAARKTTPRRTPRPAAKSAAAGAAKAPAAGAAKAPAKRTAARRAPAKAAPAKAAPAKAAPAKAAPAKAAAKAPAKAAPAKAPAKRAPAKRATATRTPAKQAAAAPAESTAPAESVAAQAAKAFPTIPDTVGTWQLPQAVPTRGRRFERANDPIQHPTPAERTARGRAARDAVPRAALGIFDPLPARPDPVALLEMQGATRVQELVTIRYGRMLTSPFAFYRGAALIMAADLASQPRTTLITQLCGDAHLSNFGAFASPERRLVFDINDFDETNPGPFEWDVKRMVTSFEIAARENGFDDASRQRIVLTAAAAYRVSMASMANQGNLDVWYDHIEVDALLAQLSAEVPKKVAKRAEKNVAKARTRDSMQAFQKLTTVVDGERRIVSQPPLIVSVSDLAKGVDRDQIVVAIRDMIRTYRDTLQSDRKHLLEQFEYVDLARKVVGVGSVGTRCWIVLMSGRDTDDPLFLQVKEAQASVLEQFTGRSEFKNSGERVVAGQRLMQAASDIFLGWMRNVGHDGQKRDFYIRQLRDWKGSVVIETMTPEVMTAYAKLCGAALAKAHARSGDRIALTAYMGSTSLDKANSFDRAMASFAASYAEQNLKDFQALKQAVESGRIKAEFGV